MLVAAEVESVDVGPDGLRVALGGPRLEAVATHRPGGGGGHVEFRILSASHQVVVEIPGAPRHVETVACGLTGGRPLRHGTTHASGPWTMVAAVERLDATAFAAHVEGWRRRGRWDTGTIVVRFPTHADALTALAAEDDGWTGVHTYPDGPAGGTIVVTRTSRAARERRPWPA